MLPGLAFASALIAAPGVIRYNSKAPSIKFGELDGRVSERAVRFREACTAAGFAAVTRSKAATVMAKAAERFITKS